VAIVQISRITNRKGLTENLPQLAGAEFGWCVDSRRLFIGNGTLQEGAPIVGNTEILTEFSDITVLAEYTYQDIVVGYAAQTGPTPSDPVVRTVQAKLDDFASVRDFGATGNGSTDDTDAINRALFQLYCVQTNTEVRRTLYFPAGTYRVTDSIIIPTYAKLVGEGADCSIILLDPDDSGVPDYVARYGDSLQQTGVSIGTNGAITPQNIEISSMTFQTVVDTDVFSVETATQCWFDSVNFIGPLTDADLMESGFDPAADNYVGVSFYSTVSNVCKDITFDKCGFQGLTNAFYNDQLVQGITVSNSGFATLYRGIVMVELATGFRAVHNSFDQIYAEAIWYDNCSLNMSAYNAFYNVGYSIGSSSPTSPVIRFTSNNNISVGDVFERSDADNYIEPRIIVTGSVNASGGTGIQLGKYARLSGLTAALADNQAAPTTITSINALDVRAFRVDYTVVRATTYASGSITVISEGSGNLTWSNDYSQNTNTGIALSASQSGNQINLRYTSTSTGTAGTINYSITYLA
jgi:hypothetical protein